MPRRTTPATTGQPVRKRRAHTKSRKGCGNCKLRQIKCDEQKPTCKNCRSFGVLCNYGQQSFPGEGTLQVSMSGPYQMGILPSPSAKTAVLGTLNATIRTLRQGSVLDGQHPVFQLTSRDLDTLARFQFRTVLTLATTSTRDLYQKESIRFACLHPYFMHLALSITLTHDRHLESSPPPPPSTTELSHLCTGTSIFNRTLQGPLAPTEQDGIWAAGSLLAASALAQIEAKTPEQAWPLGKPAEDDLTWIMVYNAKKEIWRIADPTRPNSCHHLLSGESWSTLHDKITPKPALKELPQEVIQLLCLDDDGADSANPYRVVAHNLDYILGIQSNQSTVMRFLSFISLMPHDFISLVQNKDPYALILMAYWYASFSRFRAWHIWRRCILECQAVCIYLERYHSDIHHLEKILEFPRQFSEVGAV